MKNVFLVSALSVVAVNIHAADERDSVAARVDYLLGHVVDDTTQLRIQNFVDAALHKVQQADDKNKVFWSMFFEFLKAECSLACQEALGLKPADAKKFADNFWNMRIHQIFKEAQVHHVSLLKCEVFEAGSFNGALAYNLVDVFKTQKQRFGLADVMAFLPQLVGYITVTQNILRQVDKALGTVKAVIEANIPA